MKSICILIFLSSFAIPSFCQVEVSGEAFIDKNSNGIKDKGEKSFKGLHISNGRDITSTDKQGIFSINKIEGRFIFAIKPSHYQFSLDKDFQPEFYQSGTAEIFNIPLYSSQNENKYTLVLMGDPQVYAQDQINYLGEVATDELLDADYKFMMVLGDLVGNALPVLPQVKSTLGLTRKACYYALGNHDRDRGEFSNPAIQDNDSYEELYGPDYYSFNWGNVHFLVLNDVLTVEKRDGKGSDYIPGIHPMQIEFIKNDLENVPLEKLVVVCAHIPFFLGDKKTKQTREMISLLQNHPKVFMATGHAHNQIQLFFDEDDGWENEQSIHQLVAGAICGNWWRGEPDIFGIPGSMMRDGTPPGYWFMHVDGSDYQLDYKVAGRAESKQMHIWIPQYFEMDTLSNFHQESNDIWINVYAGNEFTDVKLRIDNGKWKLVNRENNFDPYVLRILQRQEIGLTPTHGYRPLKPEPRESTHLWHDHIPDGLEKGAHIIEVTAINKYGLNAKANRVFWVK